jgi:hypothetical protein
MNFFKYSDPGSMAVIAVTFLLFLMALFTNGITHTLFLEAGVLLVSVKLIIMAYKNARTADTIHKKLDQIHSKLGCGLDNDHHKGKGGQ